MAYIDNNLMNGESVLGRAKIHKIIFIWPALWLLATIISLALFESKIIAGVAFFFASTTGLVSFVNYWSSEFGVTNRRVIMKTGLIRRNSFEILLSKVEGIQVNQNIPGRILNYGALVITGTGGSADPFLHIAKPLDFRKNIQEQISALQSTNNKNK